MKVQTVLEMLGIRKAELAKRLGISRQRVSKWGDIVPPDYAMRLKVRHQRLPLEPSDYEPQEP